MKSIKKYSCLEWENSFAKHYLFKFSLFRVSIEPSSGSSRAVPKLLNFDLFLTLRGHFPLENGRISGTETRFMNEEKCWSVDGTDTFAFLILPQPLEASSINRIGRPNRKTLVNDHSADNRFRQQYPIRVSISKVFRDRSIELSRRLKFLQQCFSICSTCTLFFFFFFS